MKIVDWINMYKEDQENNYEDLSSEEFIEAWKIVVKEVRENGYHFNGSYHQYGDYGMPIFDNGKKFEVSQRMWGRIMADAYPEEFEDPDDEFNYVEWYIGPGDLSKCKYPKGDL